ncbi:hypothetical protein GA565_10075 [Rouxiella sp. S1S-2]|uniref:hypothetical protein n=1 Tax=Rouxiella sp. S1S-2 TaxID=2653856 RepID=UPI0012642757|nr:hypothetical protein [Rouxiella sp. S1S-2]KAB7896307.1 hypothetical protein GA565_10075 [Rouxiella sp. S1S-2]
MININVEPIGTAYSFFIFMEKFMPNIMDVTLGVPSCFYSKAALNNTTAISVASEAIVDINNNNLEMKTFSFPPPASENITSTMGEIRASNQQQGIKDAVLTIEDESKIEQVPQAPSRVALSKVLLVGTIGALALTGGVAGWFRLDLGLGRGYSGSREAHMRHALEMARNPNNMNMFHNDH